MYADTSPVRRWLAQHWQPAHDQWRFVRIGDGALAIEQQALRLALPRADQRRYSDAQVDDYGGLARREFPWRPPLRMIVRARFGGSPSGTAGFGLWNHPFTPMGEFPALPQAIWFFYAAPPSNMALAPDVPGAGWKAATIDATRFRALRWAPLAPPIVLLNRFPALERRIWPHVQRDLQIAEAMIDAPIGEWHEYRLEWRMDGARFAVDDRVVLETDRTPHGPLGFVAWIDNQWAVATPQGRIGGGLSGSHGAQWIDLAQVRIERLGA